MAEKTRTRGMSRAVGVFVAGLALSAATLAGAGTASAQSTGSAPESASAAAACRVVAKQTVLIRKSPSTSSTALGQLNKGRSASASCQATKGKTYNACGGKSPWWIYVTRGGTKGYVAHLCVNWYK